MSESGHGSTGAAIRELDRFRPRATNPIAIDRAREIGGARPVGGTPLVYSASDQQAGERGANGR